MAMGDDPGGGGGDWWSDNAPPAAGAPSGDYKKVATAPDGVPVYQNGSRYFTRNPDGSVQEQFQGGLPDWLKQATQPTSGSGGNDVRAFISSLAGMPGADPSLAKDPDYWVNAINSRGGLTDANRQYWQDAAVGPKAFFNNPNRESGSNLAGSNPAPYVSNTNAPSPYSPAAWTGGDYVQPIKPSVLQSPYALPTQSELEASPGYAARLAAVAKTRERSAAAQGSVLNPGTQVALSRDAQNFASNEYGNLVGETLGARQENTSEYNADDANAFRNYLTRYGQFQDTNAQSKLAQESRYKQFSDANAQSLSDYITNVTTQRNAGNDLWAHLNDLYQTGAGLAGSSYKPGTV